MAGFALLLRWIPWWVGAFLALTALIINIMVLPRMLGESLMRPGERGKAFRSGVAFYAFSVLVLILIFRHHLEVVACAWGILAFGDGSSTLVGKALGGPRIPWNPSKTCGGSLAFLLWGSLGGAGLMFWVSGSTPGALSLAHAFALAGAASLAGAVVESLPLELDDNLSVPFLAAATVFSLQKVDPLVWSGASGLLRERFLVGLGVTVMFASGAKYLGSVTWSGVAGGVVVGTVICTFAGMAGFSILALFFILGTAATRLGYSRKAGRGIAQERQGARGAVHALANCSIPAFLAFLSASTPASLSGALRVAFVASLATAACDTLGSEVGPLGKGSPFLITRLSRVPAGTPGAVSLLGTVAGVAGACVIGLAAATLGLIPGWTVPVVALAALLGTLLESLLGATLEPLGMVGSETINFVNTAAGGLGALALLTAWRGAGP
jgi:uncharacterized protein (TIGR00297 family)